MRTAGSAQLSLNHGASAWSSLYTFLDLGIDSSDQQLRGLCFASETWIEVYELFLARSQDNKSKPMKQVLLTLTNVWTKNPIEAVRHFLLRNVVSTTVAIICNYHEVPSIKPAFQVLEHFISKSIVCASEIVLHLARTSTSLERREPPVQELDSYSLAFISQQVQISIIERFVSAVLAWVRYPDIAPIGGRLLVAFFKSLQACFARQNEVSFLEKIVPLWVKPVIGLLDQEPSLIESFEYHILPGLLALSNPGELPFLNKALLHDLRNGNAEKYSTVEIQCCLLALKLCRQMTNIKSYGMAYRLIASLIKS